MALMVLAMSSGLRYSHCVSELLRTLVGIVGLVGLYEDQTVHCLYQKGKGRRRFLIFDTFAGFVDHMAHQATAHHNQNQLLIPDRAADAVAQGFVIAHRAVEAQLDIMFGAADNHHDHKLDQTAINHCHTHGAAAHNSAHTTPNLSIHRCLFQSFSWSTCSGSIKLRSQSGSRT